MFLALAYVIQLYFISFFGIRARIVQNFFNNFDIFFDFFDFLKNKMFEKFDCWAFYGPLLANIVLVAENCVDRSVSEL